MYNRLARGPNSRKERKKWRRIDNVEVDIYGLILSSITGGPTSRMATYEDIRRNLKNVLAPGSVPPRRADVSRVLEQMTKIAKSDDAGEPVLDYDKTTAVLYIVDPFFAFS